MPSFINETGNKHGLLSVIGPDHVGRDGSYYWECVCDCGKTVVVRGQSLRDGNTKSCGCQGKGYEFHGESKTDLYDVWTAIKQRCFNKKSTAYQWYGKRGITVCEEWESSYESFRDWSLRNGYIHGLTIDRIDSNGNYCPENCRWVTRRDQARNKRSSVKVTYKGITMNAADWADKIGMKRRTFHGRIEKGWSAEKAIETPVINRKRKEQNLLQEIITQ